MNDQELADKVVALGVGKFEGGRYWVHDESCDWDQWDGPVSADIFVHDWRVAGALMEKVLTTNVDTWFYAEQMYNSTEFMAEIKSTCDELPEFISESLSRATIEACAETLS